MQWNAKFLALGSEYRERIHLQTLIKGRNFVDP